MYTFTPNIMQSWTQLQFVWDNFSHDVWEMLVLALLSKVPQLSAIMTSDFMRTNRSLFLNTDTHNDSNLKEIIGMSIIFFYNFRWIINDFFLFFMI